MVMKKGASSTYVSLLRHCCNSMSLPEGKHAHALIVSRGVYNEDSRFLGNLLIQMYGKHGILRDAHAVFSSIERPNLHSWNIIIRAFAHNGHLGDAHTLFDRIPRKDLVSWTTMISGYAQIGDSASALRLSRDMDLQGFKPDPITFISLLDACAGISAIDRGKLIHARVSDIEYNPFVDLGSSLVNMYGKCSRLDYAKRVFELMPERDVVSWTALISAYARNKFGQEALDLFLQMKFADVVPNKITILAALDVCSELAALRDGKVLHGCVVDRGFQSDLAVRNALVNMYGKSGYVEDARIVFQNMSFKDLVSWNAMISAHAQIGDFKGALKLLKIMELEGVTPDNITFVSVLSAIGYSGQLDDAEQCFSSLMREYGLEPTVVHYRCVIDLLGRRGHLDEAENLIGNMPFEDDIVAWRSLLCACKIHGDVVRGARAAERVYMLDLNHSVSGETLSNIYIVQ